MPKIPLPSNVEAERNVLGAMLMDSAIAVTVLPTLSEDLFSEADKRNLLVFQAMKVLLEHKQLIDVQSVTDAMINLKTIDDAGGTDYLLELVQSVISIENIDHYVKIIKDQALLRQYLQQIAFIQDAYAKGDVPDIGDFLATSTASLEEISNKRQVAEFKSSEEIVKSVESQIQNESNRNRNGLTGIDTGYKRLNQYTHGWQKGDLVIIAARPSVGKTAFALNLAINAAKFHDRPVGFFSCEMPADAVMKRLISADSLVKLEQIQTGFLTEKDLGKVSSAINSLGKKKLYIDDTPNPKIGDVVAKAHKLQAAHPDLCLIAIDYLNLIGSEGEYDSRANEVGAITRTLKELARQMKVPVIALAQLNRNTEDNEGRVPMLSNLKESGSIEQDADIVLLMYRKDYYTNMGIKSDSNKSFKSDYQKSLEESVEAAKKVQGKDNGISVVTINVAKNRNGRTGQISLLFDKNIQRFDNPSLELEKSEAAKNNVTLEDDDEGTGAN